MIDNEINELLENIVKELNLFDIKTKVIEDIIITDEFFISCRKVEKHGLVMSVSFNVNCRTEIVAMSTLFLNDISKKLNCIIQIGNSFFLPPVNNRDQKGIVPIFGDKAYQKYINYIQEKEISNFMLKQSVSDLFENTNNGFEC